MKFKGLLAGLGVVLLLVVAFFTMSNSMVRSENEVEGKYADIETQLQRRNDLIPNLVEVTKGYASHEEKIFTDIANARSKMIQAGNSGDVSQISDANDQLTGALSRLLVLQESYPDLKASQQFTQLADELAGTENRIAVARKDYNDAVKNYNNGITTFPRSIVASMRGLHKKEYFKASESAKEVPSVSFGSTGSSSSN
ncbi:LemA family protein [Streptococcaceae bacterium ESL0729]|nr:LemA family protein [Streptococcaceae bacterium ESL0729]